MDGGNASREDLVTVVLRSVTEHLWMNQTISYFSMLLTTVSFFVLQHNALYIRQVQVKSKYLNFCLRHEGVWGAQIELHLLNFDISLRRAVNLTPQRLCHRDKTRHPLNRWPCGSHRSRRFRKEEILLPPTGFEPRRVKPVLNNKSYISASKLMVRDYLGERRKRVYNMRKCGMN